MVARNYTFLHHPFNKNVEALLRKAMLKTCKQNVTKIKILVRTLIFFLSTWQIPVEFELTFVHINLEPVLSSRDSDVAVYMYNLNAVGHLMTYSNTACFSKLKNLQTHVRL